MIFKSIISQHISLIIFYILLYFISIFYDPSLDGRSYHRFPMYAKIKSFQKLNYLYLRK